MSFFSSQQDDRGAVLCAGEILALSAGSEEAPLIAGYDTDNFLGAKYDLRMADTGLVLPNGKIVGPEGPAYREEILFGAGETVFVSTRERLCLPLHLVGNMSIKGDLSRKGILSLTGLIVDPGYSGGLSADGRLHFRLANLGSSPIVLHPGTTRIASIQFLRLSQPAAELPKGQLPDIWAHRESLVGGLGFIDEIKSVQAKVSDLSTEFERQKRSVSYVVLAGILVIMATLLGVAVSGLLSLGADSDLVAAAKNVIPNDTKGQVLAVVVILGLAAIAALTTIALAYRVGSGIVDLDERVLARQEALREERVLRLRRVGIYCIGTMAAVALGVAVPIALGGPAWAGPALGAAVLLVAALLFRRYGWWPITPERVQARLREWQSGNAAQAGG